MMGGGIDRRKTACTGSRWRVRPPVGRRSAARREDQRRTDRRVRPLRRTGFHRPPSAARCWRRWTSSLDRLRSAACRRSAGECAGAGGVFDPRLPGWAPRPLPKHASARAPSRRRCRPHADDIAFAPCLAAGGVDRIAQAHLARAGRHLPRTHRRARAGPVLLRHRAGRQSRAPRPTPSIGRPRGAIRAGPLHGLPYGLKDLFDTAGVRTTWGAEPYRDRVADHRCGRSRGEAARRRARC